MVSSALCSARNITADLALLDAAEHRLGAVAPIVLCDHVIVARGSSRALARLGGQYGTSRLTRLRIAVDEND
jgi:hypothetical protein